MVDLLLTVLPITLLLSISAMFIMFFATDSKADGCVYVPLVLIAWAVVRFVFSVLGGDGRNGADHSFAKIVYVSAMGAGQAAMLVALWMIRQQAKAHWRNTHCPSCGSSKTRQKAYASTPYESIEQETEIVRHYDADRNEIGRSEYTREVPSVTRDYTGYIQCEACRHTWSKATFDFRF